MEQWKGQKVEVVGREQLAQNKKQKGKLNDKKRGSKWKQGGLLLSSSS
jgi:ribosome maturation factor RimP